MHKRYDVEIERSMIILYENLSEKDRIKYTAVETKKSGMAMQTADLQKIKYKNYGIEFSKDKFC